MSAVEIPASFSTDLEALATLSTKLQPGPITAGIAAIRAGFAELANSAGLVAGIDQDDAALRSFGETVKSIDPTVRTLGSTVSQTARSLGTGAADVEHLASSLTKAQSEAGKLSTDLGKTESSLKTMGAAVRSAAAALGGGFSSSLEKDKETAEAIAPAFARVASGVDAGSKKVRATVNDWSDFGKAMKSAVDAAGALATDIARMASSLSSAVESSKSFGNALSGLVDKLNEDESATTSFMVVLDSFKERIVALTAEWKSDWQTMQTAVSTALSNVRQYLNQMESSGLDDLKNHLNQFESSWKDGWRNVQTDTSDAWDSMHSTMSSIANNGLAPIKSAIGALQGSWDAAWKNMTDAVTNAFANPTQLLYSTGQDIMQGLINGIDSQGGAVAQAASSAVTNAVTAAKTAAGVKSPSTVFHDIGYNLMRGLANGISENANIVKGALSGIGSELSGASLTANIGLGGGVAPVSTGSSPSPVTILQVTTPLNVNGQTLAQTVTQYQLRGARATGNTFGQYAGGTQTAAATQINTNAVAR